MTAVRQVITIGPSGQISGLQRKPGQGIDLRQFGMAEIKRASEIEWIESKQQWAVRCLRGRYAGLFIALIHNGDDVLSILASDHPVFLYNDYDTAVAHEIEALDYVRVKYGPSALGD